MSLPVRIEICASPGNVVAPNGFPADPRPRDAPQVFLDAMDIRIKVFCDEQKCGIDPELDEDDPKSWSWVIYQQSPANGTWSAASTLRVVPPPHPPHPNGFIDPNEQPYIKITRVATLVEARGKGLNKLLLNQAFDFLSKNPQSMGPDWEGLILIHAQVAVEGMYAKFGFITDNNLGRWDEEGIEHLGMWKQLDVNPTQ